MLSHNQQPIFCPLLDSAKKYFLGSATEQRMVQRPLSRGGHFSGFQRVHPRTPNFHPAGVDHAQPLAAWWTTLLWYEPAEKLPQLLVVGQAEGDVIGNIFRFICKVIVSKFVFSKVICIFKVLSLQNNDGLAYALIRTSTNVWAADFRISTCRISPQHSAQKPRILFHVGSHLDASKVLAASMSQDVTSMSYSRKARAAYMQH